MDFTFPTLPPTQPLDNDIATRNTNQNRSSEQSAPKSPLTAFSTVSWAGDDAAPAVPAQSLPDAIVPPDFQRQKIPLEKGFSQMDWMRLQAKGKDLDGAPLNGREGRWQGPVPMEEVVKHNTPEDGWTVISGIVYNVTPYLRFHPGGAKILRSVLGKDGTKMFLKFHAWVNAPTLLDKCIVGIIERP